MNSTKPYLIRAFYEWIVDNRCTPYLVVDAAKPGTRVPKNYIEDGKIVLNISSLAVRDLLITNEQIEFHARFGGVPMHVLAPMGSIVAIYAHENGRGMVFSEEDDNGDDGQGGGTTSPPEGSPPPRGKPKLTVVK